MLTTAPAVGSRVAKEAELGRDSALLAVGFAILLHDRTSIYTYYDGELGRKNCQATNVTGGLRLAF